MKKEGNEVYDISIHDVRKMMNNGRRLVLLDIREKQELETGYIRGAVFIPYDQVEKKIEDLIKDKDVPIIVYCGFGIKSLDAGRILKRLGYKEVYTMKEGFEGWRASGYEVEGDSRLSKEQIARYSRHILLREIGVEGQLKLLRSKVLIVGAGGLGSPCALYLAAAGVGAIGIIDHDVVDVSNLQRQIIHRTEDVGRPKVESAKEAIKRLNPDVEVITYSERLSKENGWEIFQDYDLVIDGSDNFPTKYLINDLCFFLGLPDVFGGVFQFDGQISVFYPKAGGPCLRCFFPEPPPQGFVPSCSEAGILGVVPGLIGVLQAQEAIKVLLKIGEPLIGRFVSFDALRMETLSFSISKNPVCPLCGENPRITGLEEYSDRCETRNLRA
jgi:molybdopterin/thiamine biosynthesis adenylyltransferase/rhodanese-related sulfurtransferase